MACDAQTLATLSATNKAAGLSRRGLAEAIAAQAAQHSGGGGSTFSYTPDTAVIAWTDSNGAHSGNLAAFNATAIFASVTSLNFDGAGVTSISGPFSTVPAMVDLNLDNNPALASVASITQQIRHFSFSNGGAAGVAIDFQALLNVAGSANYIRFINNPGIVAVTAPNIAGASFDGEITFDTCAALTTQPFVLIQHILFQLINCPSIVTSACSLNETVTVTVSNNAALTAFTFQDASTVTSLTVAGNPVISAIDLSLLVSLGGGGQLVISGNALLGSIALNGGLVVGNNFSDSTLDFSSNPQLAALNVTGMVFNWANGGSTFTAAGCALSQASVDGILAAAVASGITSGTIDVSGGLNSSPTGGAGNANYLTLLGAGVSVLINP